MLRRGGPVNGGAVNNATVTSWVLCNVATIFHCLVVGMSSSNCGRGQSLPLGIPPASVPRRSFILYVVDFDHDGTAKGLVGVDI
jgi:hypothetical protein